jgi:hypothetical protein
MTNDANDDEDEEEEEEEEAVHVQSIPELQRLLLEYSAQMKELDDTFPEDGPEKAEMKKELEDLVELTREVLEERQKEETGTTTTTGTKTTTTTKTTMILSEREDTIENELEDLENLRQIEEEENTKRKREEEEKQWKVLKRPGGDDDDDDTNRTTARTDGFNNKSSTTDILNGDEAEGKHRGRRDAPPQNLLYRGADDKPKYDDEGNLIVPKKFQIQEDDDKVTRDRKRKQLQTFKYKQKQKAVVSEHAKRASDWNDFKTKKASKKKRLDNMSSGVFKKKSMFSGVGDGEKNVSKLTVPKKHQFHSM